MEGRSASRPPWLTKELTCAAPGCCSAPLTAIEIWQGMTATADLGETDHHTRDPWHVGVAQVHPTSG
jgi:hypothetical protein